MRNRNQTEKNIILNIFLYFSTFFLNEIQQLGYSF